MNMDLLMKGTKLRIEFKVTQKRMSVGKSYPRRESVCELE